ncbi:MAG: hypothetical protein NZ740_06950 [Kiritimatiellae bacterium]|nr:hypothetical protein [Kiritimatiellia bacterium]MDW8458835.1 hypothetical protein [Verrucomicrobiota bacterium]
MSGEPIHPREGEETPPKIKLTMGSKGSDPSAPRPPGKTETTRIDLSKAAQSAPSKGDTQAFQVGAPPKLNQTMRVEVTMQSPPKPETTRISIPDDAFIKKSGATPQATTGVGEDIFKKSTIPVGIPTPPPAPAAIPKTITVKKPVSEPPPVTPPDQRAVSEAKKGETARIDLPETVGGRPPTRPKTIRIVRPETAPRKAITISRAEASAAASETAGKVAGEESPGTVFAVVAIAAFLVLCVVIYIFAAQTFAPNLPFPGKV